MFVNIGTKRNKWFEIDGTVTSEPDLDMVPQGRPLVCCSGHSEPSKDAGISERTGPLPKSSSVAGTARLNVLRESLKLIGTL